MSKIPKTTLLDSGTFSLLWAFNHSHWLLEGLKFKNFEGIL